MEFPSAKSEPAERHSFARRVWSGEACRKGGLDLVGPGLTGLDTYEVSDRKNVAGHKKSYSNLLGYSRIWSNAC